MKGKKIYLIPTPISEGKVNNIPPEVQKTIEHLHVFIVERIRTARRFIRLLCPKKSIDDINFFEMGKGFSSAEMQDFLKSNASVNDIGVMSEAGCPGIADPGYQVVTWGHLNNCKIVPLSGPSSISMALMASGFNGQQFTFHGYLPNKKAELGRRLKEIEREVMQSGYTQLFMDAPYRNGFLLENCINSLSGETWLCIACDLDAEDALILRKKILDWKKFDPDLLHKKPAIFLIGK